MTETNEYITGSGWEERTTRLLGADAYARLTAANVLVVGLGGVGGYAVEMLVRSGIGKLTLIDSDKVDYSNINRQIIATHDTVGISKAVLFAERCHAINPEASIEAVDDYLEADAVPTLLEGGFDFVVDAIDTVAPKVSLIRHCLEHNIPIISSMGAGGRIDPTKIGYCDISETVEDGLARAVRHHLKKLGIRKRLRVVASKEKPASASLIHIDGQLNKVSSLGTVAAIPSIFGILLAQHVIRKIAQI